MRTASLLLALLIPLLVQADSLGKPSTSENYATVSGPVLDFPPRSSGSAAVFQVDSPTFTAEGTILQHLGGSSASSMMKGPFENLLQKSGRFQVLVGRPARYSARAAVSDFSIVQGSKKSGGGLGGLAKTLGTLGVKLPTGADGENPFNLDWSKGEAKLTIRCATTVQVIDTQSGALVVGETGEVAKESTTKEMMVSFGGANWDSGAEFTQSLVQFQTKIIEMAIHQALLRMMPRLDQTLASMTPEQATTQVAVVPSPQPAVQPISPPPIVKVETPATPPASPTKAGGRAKFCSDCGNALAATGKFCAHCGTKIPD
jgi:hypothetical protein